MQVESLSGYVKKVRRNISIRYDIWKRVKIYASKTDQTVSGVIEQALEKYLEEVDK